jgi:lipopolysaccharide biosynthesis regulator YciM
MERLGHEQELIDYLDHLHADFGIIAAAVERAERMRGTRGITAAIDYLLPIMEANPDPLAISRVLTLLVEDRNLGSGHMRRLCSLLQVLLASQLHFQCEHCGFVVSELYWRCPTCQYWGTIRPVDPGLFQPAITDDRSRTAK